MEENSWEINLDEILPPLRKPSLEKIKQAIPIVQNLHPPFWKTIRAGLLPTGSGTTIQNSAIFTNPLIRILEAVAIDTKRYSWKELRHTTASLLNRKRVRPIAIKDQLRHSTVKTTENFCIGSDIEYQREQIEKLILHSGKIEK
jgi:hypothetical protein